MLINHIIAGIKVVKNNQQLILIAFLFKLSLSFLLLIPLQGLVSDALSHRPAATKLLSQWDLTPIIDFAFTNLQALENYAYIILIGVIIAFMLHLFLSGGFFRTLVLSELEESERFGAERFFGWCGTYFPAFVKIAFLSAIFYLAMTILFIILSSLGMHVFLGESDSETVRFFIMLAQAAMFSLLLLFVNMCTIYIKIVTVTREPRSILSILIESFRFLRGNIGKAIALYLLLTFGLLFIIGIYLILHRFIVILPITWSILLLFFLQQVLSLARSCYRLAGYASHINLYILN